MGTTGRFSSLCKVDGIDRGGRFNVCTCFGVVSLVCCVDSFYSIGEVDKIGVVGGVYVKARDGIVVVNSIGIIDDVAAVDRADACSWLNTIEDCSSVFKTSDFWEMMGSLWLLCIWQFKLSAGGNDVGFK